MKLAEVKDCLIVYVVYKDPFDFPHGTFVVRKWNFLNKQLTPANKDPLWFNTIDQLNIVVEKFKDLKCIQCDKDPKDEKCIIQIWARPIIKIDAPQSKFEKGGYASSKIAEDELQAAINAELLHNIKRKMKFRGSWNI